MKIKKDFQAFNSKKLKAMTRPKNWKTRVLVFTLILTGLLTILMTIIPITTAPIWYDSGDDTGLVGR